MKRRLAILLAVLMAFSFAITGARAAVDTIVVGFTEFNGVFSPFFASTGYDSDVVGLVLRPLITTGRGGEPISELAIYELPEEIKDADGNVVQTVYTFKLVDGVTFSDGTPITADDIIFTYKVYCDPTYDGSGTIYTTPILGVNEYRYDDPDYKEKVEAMRVEADNVSDEAVLAFIRENAEADVAAYGAEDIMGYTGFENPDGLDGDELTAALVEAYYDVEVEYYFEDYKSMVIESTFKEAETAYITGNLSGGVNVPEIEGIKKIDDTTVQVTIEGVDPKAIWNLGGIEPTPEAYYGEGFTKGNLDGVKAKNGEPMGCGPYKFVKFENNVVSLEANPNYFKGQPLIPKMKLQVMDKSSMLESVKLGDADISDPTASPDMVKQVQDAGLHYELIDNLGYGYIGINAERVPDINVRKGLMSLMNRYPAVNSYYGELANVIERPMSIVSWAYPEDAQPVYSYDPEKALEYFLAAGYEQVEEGGATKLVKDGVQLRIEVGIGGDGIMDHPSAPILTQMKLDMEAMGAVLEINDCATPVLFDRLDNKLWDMWVAAWQSTVDPDMYQIYHSQGPTNHYRIKDDELDKLLLDARQTNDIEQRKAMYGRALDIIMDYAVEMPVYQRKNMFIFNPEIIDIETLPEDMTPFYLYMKEIETLDVVK